MKNNTLTWGLTILGLTVGLNAFAITGKGNVRTSSEASVSPEKTALLTKKVERARKASVERSMVRITDDQPRPPEKVSGPLYQPPRRGAPGGRVGGGTRGPSPGLPLLYALVPDHVAVTAETQPSLVWYLSTPTTLPLEFTVLEGIGVAPLLEVSLPSPREAGVHLISLGTYDLKFEQGKTYQWFVSLIPDPTRRSKDIIAGGLLEVVSLPEDIAKAVKQATPQEATKLLANAGFWYDALGVISQEIQANASDLGLRELRAALLEQVDLGTVAQIDRQIGL